LDVDGLLDDGFGAVFPVKGRILDAAVLFADLRSFSSRTSKLSPIETLILANNFFAWISAEGLKGRPGIVDKYIGDEVMVIFSKDFGSEDPLAEAVDAGRWMVERDYLGFFPHIGIAAGQVVVGCVGTPLKYNCSVYGRAVTLAQRCCQITDAQGPIALPAESWGDRKLEQVLTKRTLKPLDGPEFDVPVSWKMLPARKVTLKGGEELEILEIADADEAVTLIPQTLEERAREAFAGLEKEGSYRPRRYRFETPPAGFHSANGTAPQGTK
jgi:class 3 adenylate cyclase